MLSAKTLAKPFLEQQRGLSVGRVRGPGVDLHGRLDRAVTDPGGHDSGVDADVDERRGGGVAESVEGEAVQPGPSCGRAEDPFTEAAAQDAATWAHEDQSVGVVACVGTVDCSSMRSRRNAGTAMVRRRAGRLPSGTTVRCPANSSTVWATVAVPRVTSMSRTRRGRPLPTPARAHQQSAPTPGNGQGALRRGGAGPLRSACAAPSGRSGGARSCVPATGRPRRRRRQR